MSENEERHNKPDTPNVDQGAPKQAISGGGSETRAGSDAGGSASGDGAKVQSQDTEGGFKPGTGDRPSEGPRESPSFAPPDGDSASDADLEASASTESVNNTGDQAERRPDNDVDAASG